MIARSASYFWNGRAGGAGTASSAGGPVEFDWLQARSYYFYDLDGNLLEFWSPDR